MKGSKKGIQLLSILVLVAFLSSCNTYNWQRKRYYKSDKEKNWNNYNSEKTKKDKEKVIDKYYKKY